MPRLIDRRLKPKPVSCYMSRHTGYAHLPLHPGRAPAWLFARMTRLAREIAVPRSGRKATRRPALPRRSAPTGALKEGIRDIEHDLGVYALGGKGATSRKTPTEILDRCERLAVDPGPLVYASRMAAKVDSAALQDGYQLYHHSFFFSGSGLIAAARSASGRSCLAEPRTIGCGRAFADPRRLRRAGCGARQPRSWTSSSATYTAARGLERGQVPPGCRSRTPPLAHAKVDRSDKVDALKRLGTFAKSTEPLCEDGA